MHTRQTDLLRKPGDRFKICPQRAVSPSMIRHAHEQTVNMMCRLLVPVFMLATAVAAAATPPVITDDELRAEVRHARATVIITHILEKYHYRNKPLDDDLSGRILDTYLDSLDGNRSFFLDRDIKDFERYRYLLDDALDTPDLDPAFDIFKVYRQRVVERTDYAGSVLDNGFDFSIDEDYVFDRQETDWAQTGADLDETWRKKVKNDYLMLLLADKEDGEIKISCANATHACAPARSSLIPTTCSRCS